MKLPLPPDGRVWHQDAATKEWRLDDAMDDWEVLSATKVGSVRSIQSSSSTTLSVPFKLQRTHSSSTIDSADNALGPSGKGVLGVDYVEHVVLPSDTLQGICIAYKISPTRLRQANCFSGGLPLAPKKLVIPISKKAMRSGFLRVQDTDAKEFKLHAFLAEFPDLSSAEARAYVTWRAAVSRLALFTFLTFYYNSYLELADWVLKDAVHSAKEDNEWEEDFDANALRSGQIRITLNKHGAFHAQGAGLSPKSSYDEDDRVATLPTPKPTPESQAPDIATKTVKARDLYKVCSSMLWQRSF